MFTDSPKQAQIVSVTRLNRLARQILESEIGQVMVSGEISNFVAAASGHWYFTLKDSKAQVKTAMFKGANRFVKFTPKAGDKVIVRANLSIYEARGDYQLIAEHIEPEGQGQLKQAFEALKLKLSSMGMFAMDSKQALPNVITRVGLVTSSTGAAVHDILTVMQRRNPSIEIIIYPSLVQGEQAAANIAQQIELANQRNEVDLLIVGRGGGSLEDLWAFNEEPVAHAIYNSALPIISAVGHEVDVTIADYVADLRAPTPSAAAEIVSKDQSEALNNLQTIKTRLIYAIQTSIKQQASKLRYHVQALNANHPETKLMQAAQRIDRINLDLEAAITRKIANAQANVQYMDKRVKSLDPSKTIVNKQAVIANLDKRLRLASTGQLAIKSDKLGNAAQLLQSVSPLATLSRGYSISYVDSAIVKSVKQVAETDVLTTKLADGEVTSKVININKISEK